MYGEETLKYISCLLKKGTKVCSFTFFTLKNVSIVAIY